MKIITSGVDSEYVLNDLCNHLRLSGHDVTEIDFGKISTPIDDLLSTFRNKDVVYITSAHTNLTNNVAKFIAPKFNEHYPNYLSPLEIIGRLNPRTSIYIPHDLLSPFGEENLSEYRFLDLFDYILTPFNERSLQATLGPQTHFIHAGWIKHSKHLEPVKRSNVESDVKIVLFISMFEHLRWRYGDEGVVDYFSPLIKSNVKVKLPAWRGVADVEKIFNARFPSCIIPSDESSIAAILNADLVLCNGASSIHAESILMGRPTVCLLDDEAGFAQEKQKKLSHLGSIVFHDYRQKAPLIEEFINHTVANFSSPPAPHFKFSIIDDIINDLSFRY